MIEAFAGLALLLTVMVTLGLGFGFVIWIVKKVDN